MRGKSMKRSIPASSPLPGPHASRFGSMFPYNLVFSSVHMFQRDEEQASFKQLTEGSKLDEERHLLKNLQKAPEPGLEHSRLLCKSRLP